MKLWDVLGKAARDRDFRAQVLGSPKGQDQPIAEREENPLGRQAFHNRLNGTMKLRLYRAEVLDLMRLLKRTSVVNAIARLGNMLAENPPAPDLDELLGALCIDHALRNELKAAADTNDLRNAAARHGFILTVDAEKALFYILQRSDGPSTLKTVDEAWSSACSTGFTFRADYRHGGGLVRP